MKFNILITEGTGYIGSHVAHLLKVACEVAVGKKDKLIINRDDYDTIDGTTVRDYIHVSDLVEIHFLCAKDLILRNNSKIFNCSYGVGTSVKEVVKVLNKLLITKTQTKIGKRRPGDLKEVVADVSKFYKYFSWKPKYNSLRVILNSSLIW